MAREVKGHGFEKLASVDAALTRFLKLVPRGPLGVERVALAASLGRTLADPLRSRTDVPPFHRAAMDGFAVRAKDTFGASPTNPLPLRLIGSSEIGRGPTGRVAEGTCAHIATGAMLPPGADAVVMFEFARVHDGGLVEIEVAATPWDNVSKRAEDVRAGETLVGAGTRVEPQDIALAAALGSRHFRVARRPRVGVLSTGDELAAPGARLPAGKIHDANRPGALAAAAEAGAMTVDLGTARDDPREIRTKLARALASCDLVVVSGGTSVGAKDFVPEVVRALGKPGVVVHGVAMRPGYPVGLAGARGIPIVLSPGSPVAAALAVDTFAVPAIHIMLGADPPWLPRGAVVQARAARRIPGAAGLQTYARVVLFEDAEGLVAEPIRTSGSGILSSLVVASGLVIVAPAKEGIEQGERVEVRLLRALPRHPKRGRLRVPVPGDDRDHSPAPRSR